VINTLFHVLNALVVIAFIVYLFHQYLLEKIVQALALEHTSQVNMAKRHEQLRKQEQNLIRAYYHHNYLYEELSRKIDLWRQRIEADRARRAAFCEALEE